MHWFDGGKCRTVNPRLILSCAFVIAAVGMACRDGEPSAPAAGRIAFLCRQNDNAEICVISPDGSGLVNITTDPAEDAETQLYEGDNFAWSPDGQRIAFASDRDGRRAIYVVNANGSALERLATSGDASQPRLSPDGSRIAFVSDQSGRPRVYTIDLDGTNAMRLTPAKRESEVRSNYGEHYPAWSPDGTKIAFSTLDHINVINVDGSDLITVTPELTSSNDSYFEPVWSPDSTRIILTCNCSSPGNGSIYQQLFVVATDGDNFARLPENADVEDHYGPANWSPTGDRVAFTRIRDGKESDVYVTSADGGEPHKLTDDGVSIGSVWSPDGARIAFIKVNRAEEKTRLYVMDPDGSNERLLTDERNAGPLAWSPVQ